MLSSIAEQIHKKKSKAHSEKQKKEFSEKVGPPFALELPASGKFWMLAAFLTADRFTARCSAPVASAVTRHRP
jgi:hypothetical protein